MKNISRTLATLLCRAGMLAGMAIGAAAHAANDLPGGPAVNQLNLHPAASKIAEAQHDLHWFMLILCLVIFVAVFGVMFYSIFKHRKDKGYKPATFTDSVKVEIAWTVVPFIIVILMALPATKVLVAQKDTTNSDLTIKITGYQWKWGYDYLKGEGEGIGIISTLDNSHRVMSNSGKPQGDNYLLKVDNPLVVPVDKKIRIITTANDVIHAWAIPAFGVKQDAIPGFVRDNWFRADKVGDYYGQCMELCGKEHAYMPIHVKVLSAEDYSKWVEGNPDECRDECLAELERLLSERHGEIAALSVESMVQGASGMIVMPEGYLAGVRELCTKYDVLMIVDEVATGFGRTGKMFACEHERVQPDLMAAGKAITGGYLPIAVTFATEEIYQAFYDDYDKLKTFFHGHSYTGNQLGCAVALENLRLFESEKIVAQVAEKSKIVESLFHDLAALPHVGDIRQLGLMSGIELVQSKETRQPYPPEERIGYRVSLKMRELGMLTRPLGDVIAFLPPLASTADDLRAMVSIMKEAIQEVTGCAH